MEKCKKCDFEFASSYNYCPNCGEPFSMLAKQRETLKLHNAGLSALAKFGNANKSLEVQLAIKQFIDKKKTK